MASNHHNAEKHHAASAASASTPMQALTIESAALPRSATDHFDARLGRVPIDT
jgi:hypothetical protein